MKPKVLIFCIILFSSIMMVSQSDYKPGYVITNNGDTIFGEIDCRGDQSMGEICRFKSNEKNSETKYGPSDIFEYRIINDKCFISKTYNGKSVFFEYLINGIISIYYFRDAEGDHYFLEKEDSGIIEISYEEKMITQDNKTYVQKSKKHMGILNFYMQDAPELKNRILTIKKPQHKSLIKLAEDYHNEVCVDEKCIIYKKDTYGFHMSLEAYFGYGINNKYHISYSETGGIVYFWLPRFNERIFFKTGFVLNSFSNTINDENKINFKFPIQLQYLYPSKRIKPKFSVGINYWTVNIGSPESYHHTFCFNPGFNIKINNSIDLSINLNTDYTPLINLLYENESRFNIISYSLNLGLFINL